MNIPPDSDYEKETKAPFTDSLTGLFNHGFFQICLDREVNRAQRYGTPFGLALIDIDSYSTFNKKHGPVQGDRVLKEIAEIIKADIRQADLAARYADDRFAIILVKSEDQFPSIERIRRKVEEAYGGSPTVSAGIATFPRDATNEESLLRRAEDALFQAKIRGKNKVFYYKKDEIPLDNHKPRILIVDDQEFIIKILKHMLLPLNYDVCQAENGPDALDLINKMDIDLILLDVMMPDMDGYEVCRRLKQGDATRHIPIIMLTGLEEIEAKIKGIEAGADDFLTKPVNQTELLARTKSLIKVKSINSSLTSIESVLVSLADVVEARDAFTQGHIQRVSNMVTEIGRRMGISGKELDAVKLGGVLHDIGKIAISTEILNKPGPLDPKEWEILKTHSEVGYKICLPLKKTLGPALEIIRHHHEKLDGSGYPDNLKGDDVSLVSRIIGVIDIYDALISNRPYRRAISKEGAIALLNDEVLEGKLDGNVVNALAEILNGK